MKIYSVFHQLANEQHFNYHQGESSQCNYCKFNVSPSFEIYFISQQDQYSTDALIYLQAHPIICLASRIITRLCTKGVY